MQSSSRFEFQSERRRSSSTSVTDRFGGGGGAKSNSCLTAGWTFASTALNEGYSFKCRVVNETTSTSRLELAEEPRMLDMDERKRRRSGGK